MCFTNMAPVRQLTVYVGGKNPPILLTKCAKVFRDHGLEPNIAQICMGGGGGHIWNLRLAPCSHYLPCDWWATLVGTIAGRNRWAQLLGATGGHQNRSPEVGILLTILAKDECQWALFLGTIRAPCIPSLPPRL